MANSDKNILITPNTGLSGQPQIEFTGAGNSSIYMRIPDNALGTLNFESGTVGAGITLFSVDSSTSGDSVFTQYSPDGIPQVDFKKEEIILGSVGDYHNIDAPSIGLPSYEVGRFPGSSEEGTLIYDKTTENVRCYSGKGWTILSEKRDGLSPDTAAVCASQILYNYPDSPTGVYWYQTPEMPQPIQTYTDMKLDGGGWIMISRWGGHNKTIGKVFSAEALNVLYLRRYAFLGYDTWARLSRRDMNSLWNHSPYGICRIHFNNQASTSSAGIYFQKKITNTQYFDFWKGHYMPLEWSDNTQSANNTTDAGGGGTSYEVTFAQNLTTASDILGYNGSTAYNHERNLLVSGTGLNGDMGWWDKKILTQEQAAGLNQSFRVSRHMGFFADISEGNQWLFTCNPDDSRWATNENRESMVFLRT